MQKCCYVSWFKNAWYYEIKAKKSRNHTEILFKNLKIPLKIKSGKK